VSELGGGRGDGAVEVDVGATLRHWYVYEYIALTSFVIRDPVYVV